ncbi:MAG: hypothetical protein IPN34_14640 [Planctomycetes bacterium]|nr:hypothetical protein [Planctomycetota bacterium]
MRRTILPVDAFEYFFALGPNRSFAEVAKHYRVSRKTVARTAESDRWLQRIAEREKKLRDATEEKALETLEAMNLRHLKTLRIVQAKALEALKNYPLISAMEAVRSLETAIKWERMVRGEPTVHAAVESRHVETGPPPPAASDLNSYMRKLMEVAKEQGFMPEGN